MGTSGTEICAYGTAVRVRDVTYLPRQRVARAALAGLRRDGLVSAPLARGVAAHRRAVRES
jgi:hypothetical protein